jgi:hypothetical protein
LDELITNVQATMSRVVAGERDAKDQHPSQDYTGSGGSGGASARHGSGQSAHATVQGVEPKFLAYVSRELMALRENYGSTQAVNITVAGGGGGGGDGSSLGMLAKGGVGRKSSGLDPTVADDLHPRLLLVSSSVPLASLLLDSTRIDVAAVKGCFLLTSAVPALCMSVGVSPAVATRVPHRIFDHTSRAAVTLIQLLTLASYSS